MASEDPTRLMPTAPAPPAGGPTIAPHEPRTEHGGGGTPPRPPLRPTGGGGGGGGFGDDPDGDEPQRNPLLLIIAGALVLIVLILAFIAFKGDGDDDATVPVTSSVQATTVEPAPTEPEAQTPTNPSPSETTADEATTPAATGDDSPAATTGGSDDSGSNGGATVAGDADLPQLGAGGITKITVKKGDTIRFQVTSDTAQEVHVHGYDRKYELAAGETKTVSIPATIEGIFEVEFEETGTQIGEITVEP